MVAYSHIIMLYCTSPRTYLPENWTFSPFDLLHQFHPPPISINHPYIVCMYEFVFLDSKCKILQYLFFHCLARFTQHNSLNNIGLVSHSHKVQYLLDHSPHHFFVQCHGLILFWFHHANICFSESPLRKLEGCTGIFIIRPGGDICHSHSGPSGQN